MHFLIKLQLAQNDGVLDQKALQERKLAAGVLRAGGRGFYLRREGVLLNQALIQAALHHGYGRGCQPVMTPFFMRQDIMGECAQLEQFDEELYKVTGKQSQWPPGVKFRRAWNLAIIPVSCHW